MRYQRLLLLIVILGNFEAIPVVKLPFEEIVLFSTNASLALNDIPTK